MYYIYIQTAVLRIVSIEHVCRNCGCVFGHFVVTVSSQGTRVENQSRSRTRSWAACVDRWMLCRMR
jgi:hypothetical protein